MNANDPADVIEQAAQVIFDYKPAAPMVIARALHDAGLLADPADRDEQHIDLAPVADIIRNAQAYRDDTGIVFKPESAASDLFAAGWLAGRSERLARERAEAEVERITLSYAENNCAWEKYRKRAEAEVARLKAERCEHNKCPGGSLCCCQPNTDRAEALEAANAELRATVDRVREFLSEPVAVLSDGAVRDNYRMAHAALDGAGESDGE